MDKLIHCPICSNTNSSNATICRVCGADLEPAQTQNPEYLPPEIRDMVRRKMNKEPYVGEKNLKQQQMGNDDAVRKDFSATGQFTDAGQSTTKEPLIEGHKQYHSDGVFIDPNTGMVYTEGFASTIKRMPRTKTSNSIFGVILEFFKSPEKSKGNFEDPRAPKVQNIMFITAIFAFLEGYMVASRTTFIYPNSESPDNITLAFQSMVFFLFSVYIGSIVLSGIIRSSMPIDSPMRARSREMALKLNSIRSLIFLPAYITRIILLYLGDSRIVEYKSSDISELINNPDNILITPFSDTYIFYVSTVVLICYLISSIYLYISLKDLFEVKGRKPLYLALLTIVYAILFVYPKIGFDR